MKQAIIHELLISTNSHFSDKHTCKKKCNKTAHACPLQLQHAVSQGKLLLTFLINCEGYPYVKENPLPIKANPAKNFIQLNIGDPLDPFEDSKAINPYSFLSLKNFN